MRLRDSYLRLVLLFFALLGGPANAQYPDFIFLAGADGWDASAPSEWRSNLMAHNAARRQVLPVAATPIPPLTWSTSLAATAQAYSAQCVWAHSGTPGLGENLAAAAPWSDRRLASAMSWASENVLYNYSANTCPSGQQCGHYTQMVWASTTQLGCGTTNCSTGSPFTGFQQWTNTVCNYTPAGNNGQRPY